MIRSGLLLLGCNATGSLILLARNILLARLLPLSDYGAATTFAIVMAAMEMTSSLALDRYLVQSRDADAPAFRHNLHALQLLRGLLVAVLLFACAGPLARFLGVPEAAWAYQVLAVVPLARGLVHMDMFAMQRHGRFVPSALVPLSGQVCGLLAAVPLALWLGDYRAMLWSILMQEGVLLVASHMVATRRWSVRLDPAVFMRALGFGWPLMINGLLIFAIFYGDRMIVANQFGPTELAWFGAAFTITLTPTLVLAKSMHTLLLPSLAARWRSRDGFRPLAYMTVEVAIAFGLALALGFALVGQPVFTALFGRAFDPALELLIWLSLMQGVRVAKAGPSTIAVACGATRNPMFANLARVAVVPVAWLAVANGAGLIDLAKIALAGETVALALSLTLALRTIGAPVRPLLPAFALALAAMVMIGFVGLGADAGLGIAHLAAVALVVVMVWRIHGLAAWVAERFGLRRPAPRLSGA
ncbi:MAG: hypothetical protein AcusKO_00500 [Acuticoccus sp.]